MTDIESLELEIKDLKKDYNSKLDKLKIEFNTKLSSIRLQISKLKPKKFVTHNDELINTNFISLIGFVTIPYSSLLELFGPPQQADGYKVDAEWIIKFSDGTIATIYNYKNGKCYCGEDGINIEDIIDWHVGGLNDKACNLISDILGTDVLKFPY